MRVILNIPNVIGKRYLITGKTDNVYNKEQIGEIKAVPGSLYIDLSQGLLPTKLIFDDYKFHWEIIVNSAIPYWINNAVDLVENHRIAPVWLIVAKLIKLTSYSDVTDSLTIHDTNTIKPFSEVQWWEVLLTCAKECVSIVQFQNAVKTIPDKVQKQLTPATKKA